MLCYNIYKLEIGMKYKELIDYANNNHKIKDYEEEAILFLIPLINTKNGTPNLLWMT